MAMRSPLPVRDGVGATRLRVPLRGAWPTVADYVADRFGHLDREYLLRRFDLGEVVDAHGAPVSRDVPLGAVEWVWYYREVPVEEPVPFREEILYADDDLVVIDKPHFLPTTPGGRFLQESALTRLRRRLENPDLSPIHRLDRATAGLLMFSARPQTRGAYQSMFEERAVTKTYEAVAAVPERGLPELPLVYRNHIRKLRQHVRVHVDETAEPNAETRISLRATGTSSAAYEHRQVALLHLEPHTGKMHQLRVHLAALGLGILGDDLYPVLQDPLPDDHDRPLQLLARELRFTDPLTGADRLFQSERTLREAPA